MGYYLRKSLSVGPIRFNLSKSGIGVSAGIPGFRVGTGPRGNYIHIGKGGLYYRKTLSSPSATRNGKPSDQHAPQQTADDPTHGPMEAIASGSVSNMVDSSSAALLAELESKRKRMRLWPWVSSFGVAIFVLLLSADVAQWILYAVGILVLGCAVAAFYWDILKKSVVLMYDLEDDFEAAYRKVYDAVHGLARCGATWHVSARGDVYDPKYHAGASDLVRRKSIRVGQHDPPYVRTNLSIIQIPVGDRTLYFFPDQMLLYSPRGVGALSYDDVNVEMSSTRFIEDGRVPRDAKVVDHTWQYVNKSGGPDRRFKDNRQIPICEYEQIQLTSSSGLNEQLQASRMGLGSELRAAFSAVATSLEKSRQATVTTPLAKSKASTPPSVSVTAKQYNKVTAPAPPPAPTAVQQPPVQETPSMADIYDALLRIMCCVMVADGRASSTEKNQIRLMMKKVKAPSSSEEVDEKISNFIAEVQAIGFKKVLDRALSTVNWFKQIGRQDILLKCIDSITQADGKISAQEQNLCQQIRQLVS